MGQQCTCGNKKFRTDSFGRVAQEWEHKETPGQWTPLQVEIDLKPFGERGILVKNREQILGYFQNTVCMSVLHNNSD
jgi:hypothetical protein